MCELTRNMADDGVTSGTRFLRQQRGHWETWQKSHLTIAIAWSYPNHGFAHVDEIRRSGGAEALAPWPWDGLNRLSGRGLELPTVSVMYRASLTQQKVYA